MIGTPNPTQIRQIASHVHDLVAMHRKFVAHVPPAGGLCYLFERKNAPRLQDGWVSFTREDITP